MRSSLYFHITASQTFATGAHSPIGRPRNLGFPIRMEQRIEARLRLGEADRMLAGRADPATAFAMLAGAAEIVARPLPKERDLETPRARRGRDVGTSAR